MLSFVGFPVSRGDVALKRAQGAPQRPYSGSLGFPGAGPRPRGLKKGAYGGAMGAAGPRLSPVGFCSSVLVGALLGLEPRRISRGLGGGWVAGRGGPGAGPEHFGMPLGVRTQRGIWFVASGVAGRRPRNPKKWKLTFVACLSSPGPPSLPW